MQNPTVWIQKSGVTDYKGLANCVSPQDFVKHTAYLLESMQRKNANDPNGTLSHQQVVILDFENFSAWQLASKAGEKSNYWTGTVEVMGPYYFLKLFYRVLRILLIVGFSHSSLSECYGLHWAISDHGDVAGLELQFEMVRMIETHFPEVYRQLIVVNAPSVFNVLLKLVRPFASERTLKRLTVFNSDAAQWKAALLEDIDPSQLPVHYGGTQTDPDGNPLCLTKVDPTSQKWPSSMISKQVLTETPFLTAILIDLILPLENFPFHYLIIALFNLNMLFVYF